MRDKNLGNSVIVIALIGLGACQTPVNEQGGGKSEAGYATVKPGAPVALEYDMGSDAPTLGSPVAVQLAITCASVADTLKVSLTGDDGLEIAPQQAAVEFTQVEPGVAQNHVVNVTPQRNGRLFINVFITVDQAGRQAVRTFAIPLQVGPPANQKEAAEVADEDGERIISLPAEES